MSYLSRAYGAIKLAAQANAPALMTGGGVALMAAGSVAACRQTLKIEEVLEPHTVLLERVQEGESLELESYGPDAARADRIKIYTRVILDLGKLYAVPGIMFVGGAGLVFQGHRVMVKRNTALAVAFTGLKSLFDNYRGRVVDELGHEADQRFMHGEQVREIYDDESGASVTISTRDWDESRHDPYNRVFEQGATTAWVNDLGINKMFIANQQRFANELLNRRGYLYLSEVYEALGFPESDISRVVGWKVRKHPDGSRDIPNVDFGVDKPLPDDWKYNKENAVYLDFNCQGLIIGGKVQKVLERA